jgi:hypothetical protein
MDVKRFKPWLTVGFMGVFLDLQTPARSRDCHSMKPGRVDLGRFLFPSGIDAAN